MITVAILLSLTFGHSFNEIDNIVLTFRLFLLKKKHDI